MAAAETAINDKTASYRAAEDVPANYDRPLHRRKHTSEITVARLDTERLRAAVKDDGKDVGTAVSELEHLRQKETEATKPMLRRLVRDCVAHRTRLLRGDRCIRNVSIRSAPARPTLEGGGRRC